MSKELKQRGKPKKPENETKSDAFIRVVNPKTIRAIATIRQISRCVGSKYYDVYQEQVTKMTEELIKEVSQLQTRFDARNKTTSKQDIKGLL